MTHERAPSRQPLLWAALFFSVGLWVGARAWRPALWWIVAVLAFSVTVFWYIGRRDWLAKGISVGTWLLLGALLIQVHHAPVGDPRIRTLADGGEVVITAHVVREGYARETDQSSVRQPIDVETESVERDGGVVPLRGVVRLTIYERGNTK